jgi:Holliday junction resolvase RusA-like endonuclease
LRATETFRYVKHEDVPAHEALGWKPTFALYGTNHGIYAELMVWQGEGAPRGPGIILPFPLSTNEIWRSYRGRNIKSREYREWQLEAAAVLADQRPTPIEGRFSIALAMQEKKGVQPDLDNLLKVSLDALVKGGVIEGDSKKYLRSLTAYWDSCVEGCHVQITPEAS